MSTENHWQCCDAAIHDPCPQFRQPRNRARHPPAALQRAARPDADCMEDSMPPHPTEATARALVPAGSRRSVQETAAAAGIAVSTLTRAMKRTGVTTNRRRSRRTAVVIQAAMQEAKAHAAQVLVLEWEARPPRYLRKPRCSACTGCRSSWNSRAARKPPICARYWTGSRDYAFEQTLRFMREDLAREQEQADTVQRKH
jgi:hypothetical protein